MSRQSKFMRNALIVVGGVALLYATILSPKSLIPQCRPDYQSSYIYQERLDEERTYDFSDTL